MTYPGHLPSRHHLRHLNFLSFPPPLPACPPDSDRDQGGGGRGADGAEVVRGRRGGEQQGGDGSHLPNPDPPPVPQPQHPLRQPLHRAQGGEGEPHGAYTNCFLLCMW